MKRFALTAALWLTVGAVAFDGCCLVDEDLSGCGEASEVDYQLQLVTNMRTELETVLSLEADIHVSTALRTFLGDVFTDFAHDVDLSFYDIAGDMPLLEHMSEIMDANQSSYTLYLPARDYMHTCVANIVGNGAVTLEGIDYCHSGRLVQHVPDSHIVEPHKTGLFTARQEMNVSGSVSQSFDVNLYMANAATALVIDTGGVSGVKDIRVELRGLADGFNIADSTYTFNTNPRIATNRLPVQEGTEECFASVHFPSREPDPDTKVIVEAPELFYEENSEEVLWQWCVYVTMEDDTVTETILGVRKQLKAGQLMITKAVLREMGEVTAEDPYVGMSVTLNWQEGSSHDSEL